MHELMKQVTTFHHRHGFAVDEQFPSSRSADCTRVGMTLRNIAASIEAPGIQHQRGGDPRLYRLHLLVEELSELALSLGVADKEKTLDALGDLSYVTAGTAVTYSLPLDKAVREIHRSNMTKAVRRGPDDRMRDKGPEYSPPNLRSLL